MVGARLYLLASRRAASRSKKIGSQSAAIEEMQQQQQQQQRQQPADDPLAREPLVSLEFEVFGKVQGSTTCSFTRYVRDLCQRLGIVGWVKNTKNGTILGKMQGPQALVDQMANWLSTQGSPDSKIHHCEFRDLCSVAKPGYKGFQVRF